MTNVRAALPNTGGALCSTPLSLADAVPTTRVPCSINAAKTRNPGAQTKLTNETISAAKWAEIHLIVMT